MDSSTLQNIHLPLLHALLLKEITQRKTHTHMPLSLLKIFYAQSKTGLPQVTIIFPISPTMEVTNSHIWKIYLPLQNYAKIYQKQLTFVVEKFLVNR